MMSAENLENIKRLLGLIVDDVEKFEPSVITYVFNNEVQAILNATNQTTLPKELEHIAEERTVGRLLELNKKAFLSDGDFNIPQSIKEGDISITFNGKSNSTRVDEFANMLLRDREGDIICYRTLKW